MHYYQNKYIYAHDNNKEYNNSPTRSYKQLGGSCGAIIDYSGRKIGNRNKEHFLGIIKFMGSNISKYIFRIRLRPQVLTVPT